MSLLRRLHWKFRTFMCFLGYHPDQYLFADAYDFVNCSWCKRVL